MGGVLSCHLSCQTDLTYLAVVSNLDNSDPAHYSWCRGLQCVFLVCVLVFMPRLLMGWSVVSRLGRRVLTMCLPPLPCGVVKPGLIAVRNDAIKAESGHKKGWSGCNIILGPGDTACSAGGELIHPDLNARDLVFFGSISFSSMAL